MYAADQNGIADFLVVHVAVNLVDGGNHARAVGIQVIHNVGVFRFQLPADQ
ncbi:hypothetical protein D3C76_1777310 [compost metagenome]